MSVILKYYNIVTDKECLLRILLNFFLYYTLMLNCHSQGQRQAMFLQNAVFPSHHNSYQA
jgi:hypothetical protein